MAGRTAQPSQSQHALIDQSLRSLAKAAEFINYGMKVTEELGSELAVIDGEENGRRVVPLKKTMLSLCQMDQDLRQFVEVAEYVKTKAPKEHSEDWAAVLDAKVAKMKEKVGAGDPNQHTNYVAMNRRIQDSLNAMHDEPSSQPSEIQLDDDLAMTQTVNMKCPYTGKEMVRPYRNVHCNHNYEYEGIIEYIKARDGRARCPVGGCVSDKFITLSDLQENHDLRKQIERKNRKESNKKNKN